MKTIISIILFVNLFAGLIHSQNLNWPYVDYDYSKAYLYNLEGKLHGNYSIIKDGKIDSTATNDGTKLSRTQEEALIDLSNRNIEGLIMGLSSCFIPHHAIVFFNKEHQPIASIMMCFYCEGIRVFPAKKGNILDHELNDEEIKNQLDILANYESIIKELGFPVFNSPFAYQKYSRNQAVENLKLISNNPIKQLDSEFDKRFDLSGIVKYNDSIYVVADKEWNKYLYKIDTSATRFKITSAKELCHKVKIDFEGVDVCNDKFYLIEEWHNDVYEADLASCELKKLAISWEKHQIDRTKWGNKGFEGIAYDCKNELLYLAKEREPRRIFKVDLKNDIITEPFADMINSSVQGYDIADMKYKNGALYLLERGRGLITKIDVTTKLKYSVSFQHIVLKKGQRIYENKNPEYGMAEALLLTNDQIWIGIDNNGDEVSGYGKSLGLKDGNKAAILIFKRPKGF